MLSSPLLLVVFPLFCAAQHLSLPAGSICDNDGGVCKRLDECKTVDVKISRPKTCSFQGNMPVVCCPRPRASPFSVMCAKYSSESCVTSLGRTTFVKRSVTPEDQYGIVGGHLTSLKEHPHMSGGKPYFRHTVVGGVKATARVHRHMKLQKRQKRFVKNFPTVVGGFKSKPRQHRHMKLQKRQKRFVENFPEVVGGIKSEPRQHRHMALIGYGEDAKSAEWLCGGSIISTYYILTAAHCGRTPKLGVARWVRVGDLDTSSLVDDARPVELAVAERLLHPQYRAPMAYHDIALFRLATELVFNAWVGPACLTPSGTLPARATATGWGRTDIVADTSSHLLEVDLTLVEGDECRRLLGNSTTVPRGVDPQTMMCAGEPEGGKDTCSGDSGGPLVTATAGSCLKTQLGVISFGRLCALPNTPGVYTKVAHYLPWIESVVWPSK